MAFSLNVTSHDGQQIKYIDIQYEQAMVNIFSQSSSKKLTKSISEQPLYQFYMKNLNRYLECLKSI